MPFYIKVSEKSLRASRAFFLTGIAAVLLGLCFLRLIDLQIIRGRAMAAASENNHTQILVEQAPRGRLLDRNGKILADNRPVFVAFFSPLGLSPQDLELVLERLAPLVDVPRPELEHRLMSALRRKTMLRVSDRLTRDQAFLILQNRVHLRGVSLGIEQQRHYPNGTLASHVLGYVGEITERELEQSEGYRSGDWIGKSGLERSYDTLLQGRDGGHLIEVDARGRQVRVLHYLAPHAGRDIRLTLDRDLEELAERRLKETGFPAAAVVLNPETGEVLAMASYPPFDPNSFLPSGKSEDRARLLIDKRLPLYNRTIQALYPPGSTFKILTSLAELEERVMNPYQRVLCTGSHTLGAEKRIFRCWKKEGHGQMNFNSALAQSCDVYFYQVGLKLGPDLIEKYAKAGGIGRRSGVDLPSEKRGTLPRAFKKLNKQYWVGGDTLNYSIGQGDLEVTPLQMANVAALSANRGVIWQPYLAAESLRFGEPNEPLMTPREGARLTASKANWKTLTDALHEVVRSGTGMAAKLPGISVSGKTGTAQATRGNDHAWFIAYAPSDQPKVACAVIVENSGHGGVVAAPIARDLMAMALGVKMPSAAPTVPESQTD